MKPILTISATRNIPIVSKFSSSILFFSYGFHAFSF